MPDQKDIDNSVQDIFGDTADDASQGLDSLDQSDIGSSTPNRPSRGSSKSPLNSNNPLDKIKNKLDDTQDKVRKIGDAANKIKSGAQTVQNAAGKLAKGTGKLADAAGKVEKAAGKLAEAAGKVEQAAGKVEKGIGKTTNLATDATALGEEAAGLIPEIASVGIAVPFVQAAAGLTELLGRGAGTTAEVGGTVTDATGKATEAGGKVGEAIGSATQAAGQGLSAAGNMSSGAGMGTMAGKGFLDQGLRKNIFKKIMPFGTRWIGQQAIKGAEKEFGKVSTWQLVLMLVAAVLAPFILGYFIIIMPATYFMQMASGLMGDESSSGGSGPAPPYDAATGNAIADFALSQQSDPYKWGAPGSNWSLFSPTDFSRDLDNGAAAEYDCSGLAGWAVYWGTAGAISLPHSSRTQSTMGTEVAVPDLQPGDLVFFGSPVHHVGIYIGNDKYVHAPHTGDIVKVSAFSSRGDFANARRF